MRGIRWPSRCPVAPGGRHADLSRSAGGGRAAAEHLFRAAGRMGVMTETTAVPRESLTLVEHGLFPIRIHANLTPAALIEHAIARGEGMLTDRGAFCAVTSPHTGRSPKDKFVVEEPGGADRIWWEKNPRLEPAAFERLHEDVRGYLDAREVFVQDLFGGADPAYRVPVRFVTPNAWHALFVRNMFIRAMPAELAQFRAGFTVLHAPDFQADPARHGTRSGTFIVIHFGKKLVLIGGTRYAGEMKKSIFTALNYMLPAQGVMPMHCSANVGAAGDTAVFFGLSGTGKTTLSADPTRKLIGDDEHGWSDRGVFNFEGGCYAKVIRLRPDTEPEIYAATQMFGTVLENVVLDPTNRNSGLRRRPHHREHPRLLPHPFHPQPPPQRLRRPSAEHRVPHRGRVRGDAADRPADGRAGDVSLPLRVHREGGGHRAGRHRAFGHLLGLLRRAVPAASPGRLREDAGREDRPSRGEGMDGQHRVDRRPLRHRLADEAVAHQDDGARRPLRRPGRRPLRPRPGLRVRGARRGARRPDRAPHAPRHLARRGRVRRPGPEARHDVPGELRAVPDAGARSGRGGGTERV